MNLSNTRFSAALLVVVLLAIFAVGGYYRLFGTFADYDDEGYLMITLVQYAQQGHVLYDQVSSNYGPFYYLFHRFLNGTLGIPVSHDAIRFVVLGLWLVLILASFRLVSYLTGSHVAAFLACIPFGWMLGQLAAEPGHPQGLALVLIATVLVLPSMLNWNGRWRLCLFASMGACIAGLILVKPNIGGFLLMAVIWAMLALTEKNRWTSVARYLLAAACLCLPVALMMSHLSERWAQKYALLTMVTQAPLFLLLSRKSGRVEIRSRDWGVFIISSFSAGILILAVIIIQGTSLQKLIFTLLLLPMRFSSLFSIPLNLNRGAFVWAALSLLLFGVFL